jgi:hypothetical protein
VEKMSKWTPLTETQFNIFVKNIYACDIGFVSATDLPGELIQFGSGDTNNPEKLEVCHAIFFEADGNTIEADGTKVAKHSIMDYKKSLLAGDVRLLIFRPDEPFLEATQKQVLKDANAQVGENYNRWELVFEGIGCLLDKLTFGIFNHFNIKNPAYRDNSPYCSQATALCFKNDHPHYDPILQGTDISMLDPQAYCDRVQKCFTLIMDTGNNVLAFPK